MCLPLTFLFSLFSSPSFPQIAVGLHALWDNDLTDDIPAKCVTSGTVAGPHFHFVAAFKPPVMGVSVDWIEVKEVTNDHPVTPSVYTPNLSSAQPSPQCASLLGISDPQNWQWVFGDVPAGPHAFTYHNTTYQVTVQYRYRAMGTPPPYPPPMQQYGPYQISITVNVQNLVVNSGDERKLLKWDPERPEICDTTLSYSIECAQKKMVSVTISIYSTEGPKVYEVTEQKVCPGSYTFTWDGSVNMMPIPPDGKAKKGLYSFDIQVIGPAYYYDADWLRSKLLRVGEHEVKFITPRVIEGWYVLYSNRDASEAWMEVYDPDLEKVAEAIGTTHAIPENTTPTEQDWNKTVRAWAGFDKVGIWRFVFWARDNFFDFDKAHRRKLTIACNQRRVDWVINGGFDYGDLNTTDEASQVAKILYNIGYNQIVMESTPEEVMREIAYFACDVLETKIGNGLISFSGHGGGEWQRILKFYPRITIQKAILHQPATDCVRFPNKNKGVLGANPEIYKCPINYPYCPLTEYDVGDIRNYIKDEEKKKQDKPLSNILVAIWFGCFTNVKGDFAGKLNEMGVQAVLGCRVAIGGSSREAFYFWGNLFEDIWRHLSHGATLRAAVEQAYREFIRGKSAGFELVIFWPNPICVDVMEMSRLYRELANGESYLTYDKEGKKQIATPNTIIQITGENNIRIVAPDSDRVIKFRKGCSCWKGG